MSKGQKKSSSSSPSVLVAVVTTAPIVPPPPPALPVSTDDHIRSYVHSFFAEFYVSVRSARH